VCVSDAAHVAGHEAAGAVAWSAVGREGLECDRRGGTRRVK
jgi:hypothetical protein